jgi:hypothetical protein
MIAARWSSLIEPQRAISSSDRPQPEQSCAAGLITQTFTQGVWIMANSEWRVANVKQYSYSPFATPYSLNPL